MPKTKPKKVTKSYSIDLDVNQYIEQKHKEGMNKSRCVNDALRKAFKLDKK